MAFNIMTMMAIVLSVLFTPGNVPEGSSGEIEQVLDISGGWEGKLDGEFLARLENGQITVELKPGTGFYDLYASRIVDEGGGRLRTECTKTFLGIYRQDRDKLIICEQHWSYGRPTRFISNERQNMLIFHRIKKKSR